MQSTESSGSQASSSLSVRDVDPPALFGESLNLFGGEGVGFVSVSSCPVNKVFEEHIILDKIVI